MEATCLRLGMIVLALFSTTGVQAKDGAVGRDTRPLGGGFATYTAPQAPDSLQEPSGELRLPDALTLALLHNPRLASFSWALRSTEAAELQARAWPNPQVGVEYEDFAGSGVLRGAKAAEATLALSQLVLLGGKRDRRTEVARLDQDLSSWDYEIARIKTYVVTFAAFIDVLAAQERLVLVDEIVLITRDIQKAVTARVRAGGTLALEENRARVAVQTILIERRLAEGQVKIARGELAIRWGSREPQFTRAVGALDVIAEKKPPLESLVARVDHNPELARWTTELERRRARVQLVEADRVPDLNLGIGIRHQSANDDVAFLLGLNTTLPLWDRKSGAIREMEFAAEQMGQDRLAATMDVHRDIAVSYEVLASALEEIVRLRDHVLPEAEAAANESGNAYRAGAIQLTDVLDIQRTFFRLRVRYVDALARYHRTMAKLEGLVGEPLSGVTLLDESGDKTEGEP